MYTVVVAEPVNFAECSDNIFRKNLLCHGAKTVLSGLEE